MSIIPILKRSSTDLKNTPLSPQNPLYKNKKKTQPSQPTQNPYRNVAIGLIAAASIATIGGVLLYRNFPTESGELLDNTFTPFSNDAQKILSDLDSKNFNPQNSSQEIVSESSEFTPLNPFFTSIPKVPFLESMTGFASIIDDSNTLSTDNSFSKYILVTLQIAFAVATGTFVVSACTTNPARPAANRHPARAAAVVAQNPVVPPPVIAPAAQPNPALPPQAVPPILQPPAAPAPHPNWNLEDILEDFYVRVQIILIQNPDNQILLPLVNPEFWNITRTDEPAEFRRLLEAANQEVARITGVLPIRFPQLPPPRQAAPVQPAIVNRIPNVAAQALNDRFNALERRFKELASNNTILPSEAEVKKLYVDIDQLFDQMAHSPNIDPESLRWDKNTIQGCKEKINLRLVSRAQLQKHVLKPLKWTTEAANHCLPAFRCALTPEAVLEDPVIASDGRTYNRMALLNRLNDENPVSPITGEKLVPMHPSEDEFAVDRFFVTNHQIRNCIEHFVASKNPSAWLSQKLDEEFSCVISKMILQEPHVASDGFSYSKSSLVNLDSKKISFSPHTNEALLKQGGRIASWPNQALKEVIEAYNALHSSNSKSASSTTLEWSPQARQHCPAYFKCAGNGSELIDPVVMSDGNTYNKATALELLNGDAISPRTKEQFIKMHGKDFNDENFYIENKTLLNCLRSFLTAPSPREWIQDVPSKLLKIKTPVIGSDGETLDEQTMPQQASSSKNPPPRMFPNHAFKAFLDHYSTVQKPAEDDGGMNSKDVVKRQQMQ